MSKLLTDEELSNMMNNPSDDENDIIEYESEDDTDDDDALEAEDMYDSDDEEEYTPKPGELSDESSDDDDDDDISKFGRKRKKVLKSTSAKRPRKATSLVSPSTSTAAEDNLSADATSTNLVDIDPHAPADATSTASDTNDQHDLADANSTASYTNDHHDLANATSTASDTYDQHAPADATSTVSDTSDQHDPADVTSIASDTNVQHAPADATTTVISKRGSRRGRGRRGRFPARRGRGRGMNASTSAEPTTGTSTEPSSVGLDADIDTATGTDVSSEPATVQVASADPVTATRRPTVPQPQENNPHIIRFNQASFVIDKSTVRWYTRPQISGAGRTARRNIIHTRPGPRGTARNEIKPFELFKLFFDDEIVNIIVKWTNVRMNKERTTIGKLTKTHAPTERLEIFALLGILVITAKLDDALISTKDMWSAETGCALYQLAMSEARFIWLIRCLRFDDRATRDIRLKDDKFAAVREIWDLFIARCGQHYEPHDNLTVDEQLLAFRGRCPFRMYIPNKPAKYGVKQVLINCSKSKYMCNGIPYLGKQASQPRNNISLGHHYVRELSKPYHNTNRNVTADNWFTSVPLVSDLQTNCGLTYVGTLRSNKREIPSVMKDKSSRRHGSSAFLHNKEMTIVSYISTTSKTKKKNVLLLSSLHSQPDLGDTGKPEIIEYYNKTKAGTDTFDQMCSHSCCSRKTRRWPLCIFYGLVNAANVNSYIIYKENLVRIGEKPKLRKDFLLDVGRELIRPWTKKRMAGVFGIRRNLRILAKTVFDIRSEAGSHPPGTSYRASKAAKVRCQACPGKTNNGLKTKHRCSTCTKPICPKHSYPFCVDCGN